MSIFEHLYLWWINYINHKRLAAGKLPINKVTAASIHRMIYDRTTNDVVTSVVVDKTLSDIDTRDEWNLRHTLLVCVTYQQQPHPNK